MHPISRRKRIWTPRGWASSGCRSLYPLFSYRIEGGRRYVRGRLLCGRRPLLRFGMHFAGEVRARSGVSRLPFCAFGGAGKEFGRTLRTVKIRRCAGRRLPVGAPSGLSLAAAAVRPGGAGVGRGCCAGSYLSSRYLFLVGSAVHAVSLCLSACGKGRGDSAVGSGRALVRSGAAVSRPPPLLAGVYPARLPPSIGIGWIARGCI